MTTIDLGAHKPVPPTLDALPRRVALTLPELRLLAELANGAPLPFDLAAPRSAESASPLEGRLGQSRGSAADEAYAATLARLHEPAASLARRGLVTDGVADAGPAGALGLLATPDTALEIDVTVDGVRLHAWHRRAGNAVATLATVDGLVFELAWFDVAGWAGELARVPVLPEDATLQESAVPDRLDVPYELLDAAVEAVRAGRADLLPVLAQPHRVTGPDDAVLGAADVAAALGALAQEAHGRLRVMAAGVAGGPAEVVGVVSWTLLADGWRAFRPHHTSDGLRVSIVPVEPGDLPGELAPVLAEVAR